MDQRYVERRGYVRIGNALGRKETEVPKVSESNRFEFFRNGSQLGS